MKAKATIAAMLLSFCFSSFASSDPLLQEQNKRLDEFLSELQLSSEGESSFSSVSVLERTENSGKIKMNARLPGLEITLPIVVNFQLGTAPKAVFAVEPGEEGALSDWLKKGKAGGTVEFSQELLPERFNFTSAPFTVEEDGSILEIESINFDGTLASDKALNMEDWSLKSLDGTLGSIKILEKQSEEMAEIQLEKVASASQKKEVQSEKAELILTVPSAGLSFSTGEEGAFKAGISVPEAKFFSDGVSASLKNAKFETSGKILFSDNQNASPNVAFGIVAVPIDGNEGILMAADGKETVSLPEAKLSFSAEGFLIKHPSAAIEIQKPNFGFEISSQDGSSYQFAASTSGLKLHDEDLGSDLENFGFEAKVSLRKTPASDEKLRVASLLPGLTLTAGKYSLNAEGFNWKGLGLQAGLGKAAFKAEFSADPALSADSSLNAEEVSFVYETASGTLKRSDLKLTLETEGSLLKETTFADISDLNLYEEAFEFKAPKIKLDSLLFLPDISPFRQALLALVLGEEACKDLPGLCGKPDAESQAEALRLLLKGVAEGNAGFKLNELSLRTSMGDLIANGFGKISKDNPVALMLKGKAMSNNPLVQSFLGDLVSAGMIMQNSENEYSATLTGKKEGNLIEIKAGKVLLESIPLDEWH